MQREKARGEQGLKVKMGGLIVAASALHIVVLVMMKPSPLATVVGRCCSVGSPHLIRHRGLLWPSHG